MNGINDVAICQAIAQNLKEEGNFRIESADYFVNVKKRFLVMTKFNTQYKQFNDKIQASIPVQSAEYEFRVFND